MFARVHCFDRLRNGALETQRESRTFGCIRMFECRGGTGRRPSMTEARRPSLDDICIPNLQVNFFEGDPQTPNHSHAGFFVEVDCRGWCHHNGGCLVPSIISIFHDQAAPLQPLSDTRKSSFAFGFRIPLATWRVMWGIDQSPPVAIHPPQVAILSMAVAGTGLEFTPCSTVVFAELCWTPGTLVQCAGGRASPLGGGACGTIFCALFIDVQLFQIWHLYNCFLLLAITKAGETHFKAVRHSSLNCDLYDQEGPPNFFYPRNPFPILDGSILTKAILINGEKSECPLFNPQWVSYLHCVLS